MANPNNDPTIQFEFFVKDLYLLLRHWSDKKIDSAVAEAKRRIATDKKEDEQLRKSLNSDF